MATVVLLATLDTKGVEVDFVRERLRDLDCEVVVVDVGIGGQTDHRVDVPSDQVARAAGAERAELADAGDRGAAIATMARGAVRVLTDLYAGGRLDAVLAIGGSGGASLAAPAMQALPIGVPKLIVSTMAAGDTRPYVGGSDIAMLYPVVDIAGINRVSERILTNAAAAAAGMAGASGRWPRGTASKPLVAATMFGVTTPCVSVAREHLEDRGYEVLVFHATGTGGRSMEALVRSGVVDGVLDVTTTELADELVGGVLSAGPERLEAAGTTGVPQVVSVGALDMVNFGPMDSVPDRFRTRTLHAHNPAVTLMRTTRDENRQLGGMLARKLNAASGPVSVFLPLGGVSALDVPGQPFHDPAADEALFEALRSELRPRIELVERASDINDPSFGRGMAQRLHELMAARVPA